MVGKIIPAEERENSVVIALLGQPNVGKSTIYNRLTGAHQRIGNWPGKTVEIAWSKIKVDSKQVILVDLPGTYSLSGFTEEEEVAVRFIVEEKPDVIVVIADVSALARNLYPLLQALELTDKVILVVNMLDEAHRWGIKVDLDALSRIINIPVIGTIAIKGIGVKDIIKAAIALTESSSKPRRLSYGELEEYISRLVELMSEKTMLPPRFLALQLMENYEEVSKTLPEDVKIEVTKVLEDIRLRYRRDPSIVVASIRYKMIDNILLRIFKKVSIADRFTEKLDQIILRRGFDILASVAILLGGFYIAFNIGGVVAENIGYILGEYLLAFATDLLLRVTANEFLCGLLVDGILRGLVVVISFIPLIFIFTFVFALIENVGFLARMALALDKLFSRFDMSGKASFPMISSLACNVVGVVTTRIIPSYKERLRIIVTSQFVQCPPRQITLAILLGLALPPLIASAALIMYITFGFILALLVSRILKTFEGKARIETPIELPPYRLPSMKVIAKMTWNRSLIFIKRAGVIIAAANVAFWLLLNIPLNSGSLLEVAGNVLAVVFRPIGLGWKEVVSLIAGFVAKEVTIGVIGLLYGGYDVFVSTISLASLLAFLTIYAYYTPCLATLAAIKVESGSYKVAAKAVLISLTVALILGYASYAVANWLLNFP
ncbi:MAG: ferrous iron transport protein B [Crenarchaeota archaeon]|nr:ferrous iron transport protein B [Thermoproteota archaeon]